MIKPGKRLLTCLHPTTAPAGDRGYTWHLKCCSQQTGPQTTTVHYLNDIKTMCNRVVLVSRVAGCGVVWRPCIHKLDRRTGHSPLVSWLHTATDSCPPSESRKVLNSSSNKGGPGVLGLRSATRLAPCIAVMAQCAFQAPMALQVSGMPLCKATMWPWLTTNTRGLLAGKPRGLQGSSACIAARPGKHLPDHKLLT